MRRLIIAMLLLGACSHGAQPGSSAPAGTPREAARGDLGTAVAAPSTGTPSSPDPSAVTPPAPPSKVKIFVRTTPPKVWVYWGKKKLGLTPYNLERPRDSGPVDLVLRAQGYFPVHTRAYTVKNDMVAVKMVKLQDRMTIFGAKQELPPETTSPGGPATIDPLDPANALKPPPPAVPAP